MIDYCSLLGHWRRYTTQSTDCTLPLASDSSQVKTRTVFMQVDKTNLRRQAYDISVNNNKCCMLTKQ